MNFREAIEACPAILTEGAVIERLRRVPSVTLDPHILHAGLLRVAAAREIMRRIYVRYAEIGRDAGLPMILLTTTWRCSRERLAAAGFGDDDDLNGEGFRFLDAIRASFGDYARQIFIGGCIACAGDAYDPSESLPTYEGVRHHRGQVQALAKAGVDFIQAATLPALPEALGMAIAASECDAPYVLSFVLRADGTLLDGNPLAEAIEIIDRTATRAPLFYMANCVHPSVFESAIEASPTVRPRVIGLQANTSPRSPEELDGATETEGMDPDEFAASMLHVHTHLGTKILGGCCGTDDRQISALARLIISEPG